MPVALAPKATGSTRYYESRPYEGSSLMLSDDDDDENWTKLEDKNTRRRIQNRLSQRKRRQKLKESNQQQLTDSSSLQLSSGHDRHATSDAPQQRPGYEHATSDTSSSMPTTSRTSSRRTTGNSSDMSTPTEDTLSVLSKVGSARSQISDKSDRYQSQSSWSQQNSADYDQNYDDPFLMSELEGLGWTGLDLFDDNMTLSTFPPSIAPSDGSIKNGCFGQKTNPSDSSTGNGPLDYNSIENQHEIFNAQIAMVSRFNTLNQTFVLDDVNLTPPPDLSTFSSAPKNFGVPVVFGYPSIPPNIIHMPEPRQPFSSSDRERAFDVEVTGSTALHLAAQQGHLLIVQLLLDTGADVNAINSNGMSALHLAISEGSHAIVSLLLNDGASCNMRNNSKETVLHLAVDTGNPALVELLLHQVIDLDLQDGLGQTAFHRAAARGFEDVVLLLLCKGASSTAKVGSH